MNRKEFDACACGLSNKVYEIAEEVRKLAEKARNSSEEAGAAELDEHVETLEEVSNLLPTAFKTLDEM